MFPFRRFVSLILITSLITLLAACSGGSANRAEPAPTPVSNDNNDNTTPAEPATGQPVAQSKSGTIQISLRGASAEVWGKVAEAYMAKHPDVKVVVDIKPAEGTGIGCRLSLPPGNRRPIL